MKKSRLLEIIREEISAVLHEGETEDDAAKNAQIKATDLEIKALQKKKTELMKSGVAEVALEEDQLNEMAFTLKKGLAPSEKLEPRYKKENFKKVVDLILSKVDGKKTMADVARELGVIQQKIRPVVSDLLDAGILEKGEAESKAGKDVANKPGPKSKEEKPAKEKTSKEKTTSASKAEPMDGEDKEATQNVGSDSTAKELGATASVADKFANLFNAKTTEEAKKKMQELARKANSGDQKAKAFFNDKKNSKIIQAYRKAQNVKV